LQISLLNEKVKPYQIIFGFIIAISSSCSQKKQRIDNSVIEKKELNQEFVLNKEFNVEIRPDTTLSWPPINFVSFRDVLENKVVKIIKQGNQIVLVTPDVKYPLWPANLPSFLNVGDTIIISG
jgi:hypothetical protein